MDKLAAVLAHARAASPFYRDVAGPSLADFPVISRPILHSHMADILTVTGVEKSTLLDALGGKTVAREQVTRSEFMAANGVVIEQTSGSSGVPMRLPKTARERRELSLAEWFCRVRYDAQIRAENFPPLFHRALDTPLPVSPFESSAASIRRFYEWLRDRRIRWIHAPPALIAYHARVLQSIGVKRPAPELRFVESSGSPPEPAAIALIREVLDAQLINQYGTRESWAIGYAPGREPFDLNQEAVHVELLDENHRPVTAEDVDGDVAITSKVLQLLPLIRYKTGDRGRWVTSLDVKGAVRRQLRLADERDINMLPYRGKWISGNILFKDILHQVDHKIGYGYARFLQVRKVAEFEYRLIVYDCAKGPELCDELNRIFGTMDSRIRFNLHVISEEESRRLAERKPYLFVNEHDLKSARAGTTLTKT